MSWMVHFYSNRWGLNRFRWRGIHLLSFDEDQISLNAFFFGVVLRVRVTSAKASLAPKSFFVREHNMGPVQHCPSLSMHNLFKVLARHNDAPRSESSGTVNNDARESHRKDLNTTWSPWYISTAPSDLALGDSHRHAIGTMDSYLLAVSGVNPQWGDQNEFAVVG